MATQAVAGKFAAALGKAAKQGAGFSCATTGICVPSPICQPVCTSAVKVVAGGTNAAFNAGFTKMLAAVAGAVGLGGWFNFTATSGEDVEPSKKEIETLKQAEEILGNDISVQLYVNGSEDPAHLADQLYTIAQRSDIDTAEDINDFIDKTAHRSPTIIKNRERNSEELKDFSNKVRTKSLAIK